MHSLENQGRLKDVCRDAEREYQLTPGSRSAQELLAGSDANSRILSYAEDSRVTRSTTKETWSQKDNDVSRTSDALLPAPLQRLERLESELASLNHARRRLAVDDDVEAGATSSNVATTGPTTLLDRGQRDVDQPVNNIWIDYAAAAGDVIPRSCISSPFRDVGDLRRRQMSGGTSSVVSSCLKSMPPVSSASGPSTDVISSLIRFADTRLHGGDGSSSEWRADPLIHTRMWTDSKEVDSRYEAAASSALPRIPAKREQLSPPPNSAAEQPSSPLDQLRCSDEDSSRESPDGQDDVDASRSNTADNDQSKSTSPSLSLTTGQKDGSWTTNDRLKPAFWMTDYKQPKRCKKGNCTFQTVSKMEFWDHLSVHYSEDKLFRCDRCPFRTPLKHHMTSHRMNHDDDKPFSCDVCNYRAVSQSMVNSHKKSHSTVRPYVCDYPRCHYATKFVNQLTKHQEKQHPGFVASVDGGGRRRRPSVSLPPVAAAQLRCYPDDGVGGLPPPVLSQAAAYAGRPPLAPGEMTAPAMLPWSVPPWSPFHLLHRMAAAAAVSDRPLCPSSPRSLVGPRSVDLQLPSTTLPRSQSLEVLPGERGLRSTPQKPQTAALGGRRDVLRGVLNSPLTTSASRDVDGRSSFLARLAAAAASKVNSQMNVAVDDASTSISVVSQTLAPVAAGYSNVSQAPRALMSASSYSAAVNVANSHQVRGVHGMSNSTSAPGRVGDLDDRPLDLTARSSVAAAPMEREPSERNDMETRGGGDQTTVRKTSRRKGVAHKLDTTSVNQFAPNDVTNEPFDLAVPPASTRSAAWPQSAMCRGSSSPPASSPDVRGSTTDGPGELTVNGAARGPGVHAADEGRTGETEDPARLQRKMPDVQVGGGGDGDGCRRLNGVDAGGTSATMGGDECRHCGFVFKHPAMFDIHMGFHKFDEPWRCNRCGHRCTDCVDFNRHIANASHVGQV